MFIPLIFFFFNSDKKAILNIAKKFKKLVNFEKILIIQNIIKYNNTIIP